MRIEQKTETIYNSIKIQVTYYKCEQCSYYSNSEQVTLDHEQTHSYARKDGTGEGACLLFLTEEQFHKYSPESFCENDNAWQGHGWYVQHFGKDDDSTYMYVVLTPIQYEIDCVRSQLEHLEEVAKLTP